MTDRIDALRQGLAEAGHDAFFSLSPVANAYLTGFHGSASAVIVTASEAHFFCDFRYEEQAGDQVRGCAVEVVAGVIEQRVGERLAALGARTAAFDPFVLSVWQRDEVAGTYAGELRPEPDLVRRLRMRKSPGELDLLQAATDLAEGVLADAFDMLAPGLTERALAAFIEHEFRKRGASGASFPPIVLFGARSSLPHGMPGERALREGDIVLIDLGCVRQAYCSDLTRTAVFGTIPGPWFEEIYHVTLAAQEAALNAIAPGVKCADVDAVARDRIAEAGFGDRFGHGLGHGVGLEVHEAPRLNKESDTTLEPGMVVTVEPGIYLPGQGGVRIEDLVAVTDDGARRLTQTPKALKVIQA